MIKQTSRSSIECKLLPLVTNGADGIEFRNDMSDWIFECVDAWKQARQLLNKWTPGG
jgi:hypothetical protein